MWVVKLGGSLAESPALKGWLATLALYGAGRVVIVPGGGRFADQVRAAQRHWRFSDQIAHQMALLAMQQNGLMLTGLRDGLDTGSAPEQLMRMLDNGKVPVWLPSIDRLDQAGLPACWDITSDTLAAWLAQQLGADHLALVKSVALTGRNISSTQLVQQGIVDPVFPDYLKNAAFQARVYGRDDYASFGRALNGRAVTGSRIVFPATPAAMLSRKGGCA